MSPSAACAKENRSAGDGARRLSGAAIVAGLLIGSAEPTRALDCPMAQPATSASALKETPQDIQTLSNLMAAQGTGVVPEIIAQLKRKYPAAQDAEISNYMVTLYGPMVDKDAALRYTERSTQLSDSSSQVRPS